MWLAANGEALYGSRPWVITESVTTEGTPLRFTKSGEGVYALVMGMPPSRVVTMRAVDGSRLRRVRIVGANELLEFSVENGELTVILPERLPLTAVTVLDLGPEVRARLGRADF
jgi:alpha-L-fucosidase